MTIRRGVDALRRALPRALATAALVAAMAGSPARAESVSALVEEGNALFREQRFNEALEKYRRAQQLDPRSPAIRYNIGNVLYQLGEHDKAYDEYRQAFAAREKALAEGARFNAGNSYLARRNWPEAIRNYQEALRLDPTDRDAKKNLELALGAMEEERRKQQKQRQQGEPPPQPDSPQDEQDQRNQKEQEDKGGQDQKQDRQGQPQGPPRDQKQGGAKREERLSREEALRLLQAMKSQDRGPRNPIMTPPPDRRPERDW